MVTTKFKNTSGDFVWIFLLWILIRFWDHEFASLTHRAHFCCFIKNARISWDANVKTYIKMINHEPGSGQHSPQSVSATVIDAQWTEPWTLKLGIWVVKMWKLTSLECLQYEAYTKCFCRKLSLQLEYAKKISRAVL